MVKRLASETRGLGLECWRSLKFLIFGILRAPVSPPSFNDSLAIFGEKSFGRCAGHISSSFTGGHINS